MTKEIFLEKLIEKKESWQFSMPVFEEKTISLSLTKGITYYGTIRLYVEGNAFFECLVEPLKGLVEPMEPFLAMKNPMIEYRINTDNLRLGYEYEEKLTCYYIGGQTDIIFRFIISDSEQENPNTNDDKVDKKTFVEDKETLNYHPLKATYHLDETIHIGIENLKGSTRHLILKCNEDMISPKITEIYLNDSWTQEWFIKKTLAQRLFKDLAFKNKPFKKVIIDAYVDHEENPSFSYHLSISLKESYESRITITSLQELRREKVHLYKLYIDWLVQTHTKKNEQAIIELAKGILNYDQEDFEIRLFYIWLLIEFSRKKEAKDEIQFIDKYKEYFETKEEYPLVNRFRQILYRDNTKELKALEIKDSMVRWLEILTIARYTQSRQQRYSYYLSLYNSGERGTFLFAEVASLLNQQPISPDEKDGLYIATLIWALNKKVVYHGWMNKIESHYYQLEKNPYMTSHIAFNLHKLKPTKNILRLVCFLCISEERYDKPAFLAYEGGLLNKIYIHELDVHYIKCAWKVKQEIDLNLIKHFTKIQGLESPVREYMYLMVVKQRNTQNTHFRRYLPEIISYLSNTEELNQNLIHIYFLLMDDFIKEQKPIFYKLFSCDSFPLLLESDEGKQLIIILCDLCQTPSSWLPFDKKKDLLNVVIENIGYEGLINLYNNLDKVLNMYDQRENDVLEDSFFLQIHDFELRHKKEHKVIEVLKGILVDDFINNIGRAYFALSESERCVIQERFFYYVSSRIVLASESIQNRVLEAMYIYYVESLHKPTWLLLGLVQGLGYNNHDLFERVRKLYEDAKKHDIIVPWFNDVLSEEEVETIHYMANPKDLVVLCYRFSEDLEFEKVEMKHLAFGVFVQQITLFYGEFFEYYVIVENESGGRHIPHSQLIKKDNIDKESLSDYHNHSMKTCIDNVLLSYELNDLISGQVFIDEQLKFISLVRRLPRV